MKLLLFVLLSAFLSFGNTSKTIEVENSNILISVTFADGSETTFYSEEDLSKLDKSDVVACTYSFSNGECTVTASSCAGAKAGFEACACAVGHSRYCKNSIRM